MAQFKPAETTAHANFEKTKTVHVYFKSEEEVASVIAGANKARGNLSGFCRQAVLFAISQMEDGKP